MAKSKINPEEKRLQEQYSGEKNGSNGGLTSANANGARYGKTTANMVKPGTISRTIMLAPGSTVGVKMGLLAFPTTCAISALASLCGMAKIPFSRSAFLASLAQKATTGRTSKSCTTTSIVRRRIPT